MLRRVGLILTFVVCASLVGGFAASARTHDPTKAMGLDTALTFYNHGVELADISAAAGDSITLVARWGAASNASGAADSYRVRWVLTNEQSAERIVTLLEDRLTIGLPPLPDSLGVRVVVWAIRRNLQSLDSVRSTRYFKSTAVDQPPPPPGPVIIDTVAVQVDTVALFYSKAKLAFNDGKGGFVVGTDTAFVCAAGRVWGTGKWHLSEYGIVLQGVGKDSLLASGAIRFPASRCLPLIAKQNGPAVDTSSYLPTKWRVGITPQFGATPRARGLPSGLFLSTT